MEITDETLNDKSSSKKMSPCNVDIWNLKYVHKQGTYKG